MTDRSGPPRLMHYSHDLAGLGHLRPTLAMAESARVRCPSLVQLIVTGASVVALPPPPVGVEYLKLPHAGRMASRGAPTGLQAHESRFWTLAGDLLLGAARMFRPHVLLVDDLPAGVVGEVVPLLHYLRHATPTARLVVGLRDVSLEPALMRAIWQRRRVCELLDEVYDRILIYGQPDIFDLVTEYGLSPGARARARYVGYPIRQPVAGAAERLRRELAPRRRHLVLVTAGGGSDGEALYNVVLACLRGERAARRFDWLIVGGPLLPVAAAARLRAAADRGELRFLAATTDLPDYIAAADAVVSRGGYNTLGEVLAAGRPAVVVPRVEGTDREQLVRAEAFQRHGLVRMIHPAELTPGRLLVELRTALAHPPRTDGLALDGLANVADELAAALAAVQ